MATATSGRAERRTTRTGRSRTPDLRRYYAHRLPAFEPGDTEAEVALLRGGEKPVPLDRVTETVEWTDDGPTLSGSVTLRRPEPDRPGSLPVARGHQIRLRVRWASRWYQLWIMRCYSPEVDVTGTVSVELADSMDAARRTERRRLYRKDHGHPRGWTADEMVRAAARADGVRLGTVATGTRHFKRVLIHNGSLLDVAHRAYSLEAGHSGRRFIFRMRDGRFEVVPYRRNQIAYVISPSASAASVRRVGAPRPATVLTGKGRVGKGKGAKHIEHTEFDRQVVQRFGYVHQTMHFGRVDSAAELRSKTKRALARILRVVRSGTFEIPLNPFIRRGDAVMVNFPREGFEGRHAYAFVTSVTHSLSATSSRTTLEVQEQDPYRRYQEELERIARARKRRARGRTG